MSTVASKVRREIEYLRNEPSRENLVVFDVRDIVGRIVRETHRSPKAVRTLVLAEIDRTEDVRSFEEVWGPSLRPDRKHHYVLDRTGGKR